ncbi:hypothetical protein TNCV_2908621 [Trichonephila clavipes]|nr:hypothetical protein TNCV_2908621 [Trichonephila clavipes]
MEHTWDEMSCYLLDPFVQYSEEELWRRVDFWSSILQNTIHTAESVHCRVATCIIARSGSTSYRPFNIFNAVPNPSRK